MADLIFNRMMKYEVEKVWIDGKIKNMRKVETLLKRWKPKQCMEKIRDVKYADKDLEDTENKTEMNTVIYESEW